MGSYSTPPAPDYAAASREGVMAQAETLPFSLAINQAANQGTKYTDPATGKTYDFTGSFDSARFWEKNPEALRDYQASPEGRTPEQHARDWLAHTGKNPGAVEAFYTGSAAYRNQTDIDSYTQLMKAGAEISAEQARKQYGEMLGTFNSDKYLAENPDVAAFVQAARNSGDKRSPAELAAYHYNTYGKSEGRKGEYTGGLLDQFNDLNLGAQEKAVRKAMELMPLTSAATRRENELDYLQNLRLGKQGTTELAQLQTELLPMMNRAGLAAQGEAFNQNLAQADTAGRRATALQQELLPALNKLGLDNQTAAVLAAAAAGRQADPLAYAARDTLGQQVQADLARGGEMNDAQRRRYTEAIRAGQATRGNILGDSAAFEEALKLTEYGDTLAQQRQANALAFLNSRSLDPNFTALAPINTTQVVTPNSRAVEAVNVFMPNANSGAAPNLTPTTAAMPSLNPANVTRTDPLAMLNNASAGAGGANYNLNAWSTKSKLDAENSVNPWMAGLSTFTNLAGSASKAGGWGKLFGLG